MTERDDLDRYRSPGEEAVGNFGTVDDDDEAGGGGGDDPLAEQGAAEPLDQGERADDALIGTVDGKIQGGPLGEARERDAEFPGASLSAIRGRDASDP